MTLKRWDVIFLRLDDKDTTGHPAVVLSPPDILENEKRERINVLMGTKKQAAETARPQHVILNGADGLEFSTLIDCSLIYVARKRSIIRHTGTVAHARRGSISTKVRAALGVG